ncbi:MAG: carbohydrate ABC transporter permease [Devosia sp.]|uniref:carbohydrate ABC transporter permease n=1 Tax=Devosia sp. TaxID=1871048 RepID=UPI003399E389
MSEQVLPLAASTAHHDGPRPATFSWERAGIYAFLLVAALFFLLPIYTMVSTSLKTMAEVRATNVLMPPLAPTIEAWGAAWSQACTGLDCGGVQVGFLNSLKIVVPVVVLSILVGALNGYVLSFWRFRGANLVFTVLMFGAFIPLQMVLYPLVRLWSSLGLYGSLPGLIAVHVIFGLPVVTLMYRNFYAGLPIEIFKAARVDGAGFWRIFWSIFVPMSAPITIVVVIWQTTGAWNDYILGLTFGGRENAPMTVQLNNIIASQTGERQFNVEMAATMLTAMVPLLVYMVSGRWFVRGITAGAVKG